MFSSAESRKEAVQETRPPGWGSWRRWKRPRLEVDTQAAGAAEHGRAKFSTVYTKTPEIRFVFLK